MSHTPAGLRTSAIRLAFLVTSSIVLATGCTGRRATAEDFRPAIANEIATTQPTTTRTDVQTFSQFRVHVTPPAGWDLRTTSVDDRHEHMTWVSPGDQTAFGVIFFRLPWPVGHEMAFRFGFLAEMKAREKTADVLEKYWDPSIEGLRFTVDSPNYRVQAKFLVRGLRGFAAYSGTRHSQPVNEQQLEQAARCRETVEFAGELEKSAADERR